MEDESSLLKPQGFILAPPLFDARNLQEFFQSPPRRSFMTGTISQELDTSTNLYEYEIISLLGMKHAKEITARYRQDLFAGRLPFNHSTETQAIFLSSYVLGHAMRQAGGTVYLYSYENPRHAAHTDDLSYIMGVHSFEQDPNEKLLAVIYPKFFIDFIKTGKPRKDWTPLQEEIDNYMFIDVNVYNKTMPHMADHYESDVVSYWKKMQEFDYLLTRQEEKAPELREMAVPDRAPGDSVAEDSVGFLFISLPVIVVILSVLIIGYLVRRRQLRRASAVEIDEKTPLFSSI